MSKIKFTEEQTIRIGLVEKVECDGVMIWKLANMAPSWAYKYLLQHGIDKNHMTYNPFATEECADWLRVFYPDKAVFMGLADTTRFTRHPDALVSECDLQYTGVQFVDSWGDYRIRLTSHRCPAALVEYIVSKFPDSLDALYGSVRSEMFMDEEFAEWVCERDKRLADLLGVGCRVAVRFAEPLERAWP